MQIYSNVNLNAIKFYWVCLYVLYSYHTVRIKNGKKVASKHCASLMREYLDTGQFDRYVLCSRRVDISI